MLVTNLLVLLSLTVTSVRPGKTPLFKLKLLMGLISIVLLFTVKGNRRLIELGPTYVGLLTGTTDGKPAGRAAGNISG